jgi:hypothetical protein
MKGAVTDGDLRPGRSVAVSWCFSGDPAEDTPYSRRVLQELIANDAIVPEVWAFETANSIFVSYPLLLVLRRRWPARPCSVVCGGQRAPNLTNHD